MTAQLQTNMKTARQVAYSFYQKNFRKLRARAIDDKEVIAEAYFAMTKAMQSYDPNKGRSIRSWTAYLAHRNLNKMLYRETKIYRTEEACDYDIGIASSNAEEMMILSEKLDSLSDISKYIMRMIYNAEIEIADHNKNTIKRAIKDKLREEGYAYNKIKSAFKELKLAATTA